MVSRLERRTPTREISGAPTREISSASHLASKHLKYLMYICGLLASDLLASIPRGSSSGVQRGWREGQDGAFCGLPAGDVRVSIPRGSSSGVWRLLVVDLVGVDICGLPAGGLRGSFPHRHGGEHNQQFAFFKI